MCSVISTWRRHYQCLDLEWSDPDNIALFDEAILTLHQCLDLEFVAA